MFSTAAEPLDRSQAYWFEAAVVGNFYAPLEISPSNLDGLIYDRNGSLVTVRVRNRTAATVNLTVAPVTSAPAPVGQEQITADVPLTYRTFSTSTNAYVYTPVTTAIGVVVGRRRPLNSASAWTGRKSRARRTHSMPRSCALPRAAT